MGLEQVNKTTTQLVAGKEVAGKGAAGESFHGWKLVTAILVLLTFSSGLSFYNHTVILNALAERPGFTVESASLAVSLFFIAAGFTGLLVARMLERFDPRWCLTAGALASAAALASLSWVDNLWHLYAVYILFGAGFAASSLIPATTLVSRWFSQRRAMALSVASTGLSLGGVLVTPLCAALVDHMGLVSAAPMMGLLYLLGVIPVSWMWVRSDPESMGQRPDGAARPLDAEGKASPLHIDGVAFQDARRGRLFWCLSTAYVFLMMAQVGGIAHQLGLAREQLSESQTTLALAVLPVASIVGRLVGGWMLDHTGIRKFAITMMVVQIGSLSLLSAGFTPLTLVAGLALFGVSVGNLLMLHPLLIATAFGLKAYARIFSLSNLMSSWGTACGPALLGLMYGISGGHYSLSYAAAAVCGLVGLGLFLAGGPIRKPDAEGAVV